MLALLWSSKEADEELAVQRTAPCLLTSSVFKADGIPGVILLPLCSPAPLQSDRTLVFSSADLLSFKEAFPCSFHRTYRTIHLYFGSILGWVVTLASHYQFILVEY